MAALFDQYRMFIGIVLFGLLAVWKFWPALSASAVAVWSRLTSIGTPAIGTAPIGIATVAIDEDTLDFQALKRLQARFRRQNCKEGQAAVDTCSAHFFHGAADSA